MSETESVEEKVEVVPKKVIGMHDITHPKRDVQQHHKSITTHVVVVIDHMNAIKLATITFG